MKLRDYQEEAVDHVSAKLAQFKKVALVAPTASGKSVICAEIVRRFLEIRKVERVLVLCHQGHLLIQNEQKIHEIVPDSVFKTGVYCASEKRKETTKQIILASRDSLGRDPSACGKFSLVIVDECHLIDVNAGSDKSKTYYSKIFQHLGDVFVVGLTGTPWRLSGGLVYGDGKFFQDIGYEIKMAYLIEKGYLSPYTLPKGERKIIDTTGIKITSTGDYSTKDLEEVSMPEDVIEACLDSWEKHASDRKTSIFFCCSVDHAKLVEKLLHKRLKSDKICYVDGKLTGEKRKQLLARITAGEIKAIVNIGVLTTGFDAPVIDCVVMLRGTASVALFVQCIGRGLRTHPGKDDCLVLDLAGNFERFGSVEDPIVEEKAPSAKPREIVEEGEVAQPGMKICSVCGCEVKSTKQACPSCGYMAFNHEDEPFTLSPKEYDVQTTMVSMTTTRKGDEAAVVTYSVALGVYFTEWLVVGKKFFGQKRAVRKLEKIKEREPKKILVTPNLKNPKFPNIEIVEWGEALTGNQCRHLSTEIVHSPSGWSHTICNNCQETL